MAANLAPLAGLAQKVREFSSRFSIRENVGAEVSLYYRRACLAAAEERYDDALIFCSKSLDLESSHLPTRLLVAQIHDRGRNDAEAALECYRKVLSLCGYDAINPYGMAAREAIDKIVEAAGRRSDI
jgi:tetratricopeptide (TPR) repeat protein